MNCSRCARWMQLGLAVLVSSLTTAVHAATLEDYADIATAVVPHTFTAPDPLEVATPESLSDTTPVKSETNIESSTGTSATPDPVEVATSEPLSDTTRPSASFKPADSIREHVVSAATLSTEAVSTTQNIFADEELGETLSHSEVDSFHEIPETLSDKIAPLKEPSLESVGGIDALPTDAFPTTRVIPVDEEFGDTINHGNIERSDNELTDLDSPEQVSIPKEAVPTTVIMPPEATEPSVEPEEILIAQVVPDDTLGAESSVLVPNEVIQDAPADLIEGGATRGSNLFHSFEEFSIGAGQRVYFTEPVGIENILSRVTGKNTSEIDGLLGVAGTANLFFLNPNGITFGPNAELDISGSFTASTADSVDFLDDGEFSAVKPQGGQFLTMSVPSGVQFNQQSYGDVVNAGVLETGQNLALSGNQLYLEGQLVAGDNLTLRAEEKVTIRDTETDAFTARSGGELTIKGNQGIDIWALQHLEQTPLVSGGDLTLISDGMISGDAHFESGGNLEFLTLAGIPGNFVSFYDPIILANGDVVFGDYEGVALKVETTGSIQAGDIVITDPDITLMSDGSGSDEDLLASSRAAILRAGVESAGNPNVPQAAGGTTFTTNTLVDQPLDSIVVSSINTSDDSGGPGGPIILAARGNIVITGSVESIPIFVSPRPGEDPFMKVALRSSSLSLSDSVGDGGDISVSSISGDILINGVFYSYSFLYGAGNGANGGNISISSGSGDIRIENDLPAPLSLFDSSSGLISGMGGDGGDISISSTSGHITTNGSMTSGTRTADGMGGDGGDISISSTSGHITTNGNTNNRSLNSGTRAGNDGMSGDGGDISISSTSGHIAVTGDIETSSYVNNSDNRRGAAGAGGSISISSISGHIITERSLVSRSRASFGVAGDGGDISISSGSGNIITNERLNSSSSTSIGTARDGGDISISSGSGHITTNEDLFSSSVLSSSSSIGRGGDGGNINIFSVSGDIRTNGDLLASSTTFSNLDSSSTGDGGDVSIVTEEDGIIIGNGIQIITVSVAKSGGATGESGAVTLESNSTISGLNVVTSSSAGQSGDVKIQGFGESLTVDNLSLITSGQIVLPNPVTGNPDPTLTLNLDNFGLAGETSITSAGNLILNNFESQGDANGSQPAGSLTITSPSQITFNNSRINSNARSDGNAGEILIKAARLSLGEGDLISAATTEGSSGDGGTITINTTESISLGEGVQDSAPVISVEASGAGRPGDIVLNTPNFVLSETAQITATATESATNLERGGSVTLSADQMDLAGTVRILAETQGQSPGGMLTLQPYQPNLELTLANPNLTLTLADDAVVSAATTSSGNGGSLQVFAPDTINISGPGRLSVETSGSGPAGNITANAQRLTLSDGVTISASTERLGRAGDIGFDISDTLTIDSSTVESRTTPGSTGFGGNIDINAGTAVLRNGGLLAVNSEGEGKGGEIMLTADELSLDNGQIIANTRSSDGGDLVLTLQDLLLLKNGSLLSTEAGTADAGGNGGDINISVADGFVIVVPDEDNDIIANAFEGSGGEVNITANRILGLTPRRQLTTNELRDNSSSDVSASSELGLEGEVDLLNTLLDPSQGLTELPANVEDPTNRIARGCRADDIAGDTANPTGDFVITGRSGQPLNPSDSADDATTLDDLGPVDAQIDLSVPTTRILEPTIDRSEVLEDAQKAIMTDSGDILLVANDTWHSSVSCSVLR